LALGQLVLVAAVQAPWPLQTEAPVKMSSLAQVAGLQTVVLPG
jgi:hypothetical protein